MQALLRLLCAGTLSLGLCAQADVRTFTDSASGRTLSAEVVSATATDVTLKLSTGATHTLPLSRLSGTDRTYVAGWLAKNPSSAPPPTANAAAAVPIRYAFNVTWQREKSGEKVVNLFPYKGEEEQWVCKFKITNLSSVPLEDVELRYQIHLSLEREGKTATSEVATGTDKAVSLARNQATEISAKPVPLLKLKLDGDYITTDGSRPTKRDSIKGVGVGLFHKGVLVHEYRSTGIPVVPFSGDASKKTAAPK
jgi:hypothetical protein